MENRHITDHVKELTSYFEKALDGLVAKYDFMTGRRGMGLMQGIVIDARIPVGSIVTKALEAGLIVLSAGGNVLRLLPPLVIEKEDIDHMVEILTGVCDIIS